MLPKFPMSEILINRKKHSNSKKLNEKLGNRYYAGFIQSVKVRMNIILFVLGQ